MNIRIKHEGKCRKIAQVPKTIEELRSKIAELFGASATKFEITYKDCDGELVSVVDSEDLKNCIEEAETFKMTCVTLLLKNEGRAARSVSSKKSAQTITESASKDVNTSSDEDHGFKVVKEKKPVSNPEDQLCKLKLIEEKQRAEAEIIKKKLIEEHMKALAELEKETSSKIEKLHKEKNDKRSNSCNKGDIMKRQQKMMMKIRCINQFCNGNNIENPVFSTMKIFKELKEQAPEVAFNPVLMNLIVKDASSEILEVLLDSYKKIIAKNPELAKAGVENKEKFCAIKDRVREMRGCHKPRHEESSTEKVTRETRRAARMAMIDELKERKHQEKDAKKLQKEAEKAEKHARKAEEKQEKHHRKASISDQEKKIRDTVSALKEIFPNAKRPHMRAIVMQNPNLSVQELTPLIKASKLAKSN